MSRSGDAWAGNAESENMKEMTALDRLVAIEEIKRTRARYCRGIDTKDWALLASTLAPDITLDLPSLRAAGREVKGPEAFLDLVQEWFGSAPSLHANHLPEITIHSHDRATAIWAQEHFLGPIYLPGEHHGHGYGYSHDEYVQIAGTWLVGSVRLEPLFTIT